MKKSIVCLSILVASGSVFAEEGFNTEVAASYFNSDAIDNYAIGGIYYFDSVSTTQGPLAEASFLDLESSVSAVFERNETVFDDFNTATLAGTYSLKESGIFLSGSITHFSNINSANDKLYGFGGGYYLSDIWAVYGNTEFDEDFEYLGFAIGSKKLISLGDDRFVNIEASYGNPDEGKDSFAISSDYYFNTNLSVGIGLAWDDELFDPDTTIYTARSQWFVSENVSLQASIDYIDGNSNSDTAFSLGARARF
jgi:hypothetical protein